MLKAAALVVIGIPLALLATLLTACFATGVAVVDVREGGPDGHRVVVPVPLVIAQAALALAPADATRLDLSEHGGAELREQLRAAHGVLEALADAPDGELVRVEEPGTQVVIEKRGGSLHVEVHDGDDDVEVNVPLDAALEAVSGSGEIDASALVGALRQSRLTKIVDVRSGEDHVQVAIW
jgi:hypothetical protein